MTNPIMKFTQPNIDAIRDRRKTQTRRPIKPQPDSQERAELDATFTRQGLLNQIRRVADPDGVETDLLIRITGVRAERLQGISEEDALAEGITDGGCMVCGDFEPCGCDSPTPSYRESFIYLWSTIYGPDNQFAWERNPWVFIYKFEVVA